MALGNTSTVDNQMIHDDTIQYIYIYDTARKIWRWTSPKVVNSIIMSEVGRIFRRGKVPRKPHTFLGLLLSKGNPWICWIIIGKPYDFLGFWQDFIGKPMDFLGFWPDYHRETMDFLRFEVAKWSCATVFDSYLIHISWKLKKQNYPLIHPVKTGGLTGCMFFRCNTWQVGSCLPCRHPLTQQLPVTFLIFSNKKHLSSIASACLSCSIYCNETPDIPIGIVTSSGCWVSNLPSNQPSNCCRFDPHFIPQTKRYSCFAEVISPLVNTPWGG